MLQRARNAPWLLGPKDTPQEFGPATLISVVQCCNEQFPGVKPATYPWYPCPRMPGSTRRCPSHCAKRSPWICPPSNNQKHCSLKQDHSGRTGEGLTCFLGFHSVQYGLIGSEASASAEILQSQMRLDSIFQTSWPSIRLRGFWALAQGTKPRNS